MPLRLSKKWVNPLYFILNDIVKDESIRTVLVYGGKASAKTVSITQILTKECYVKEANAITFRKESAIIPTTLKKSFNLAIETLRLNPVFEKQDRRFLCDKGSEIVMKGLDDEEKAKGVESFKHVYVDELNQFLQSEWEQMDLSLRGIPGQKMWGSWNPVNDQSWIKTEIVDKTEWKETHWTLPCEHSFVRISADGKTVLIKTTYEDNYWIVGSPCGAYGYRDENLIARYKALEKTNSNSYKVNVLGEWGKTTFGGEILKCWRSENHTGLYPYNPDLAIYLSFDENVNPYFPCGFFQVDNDQKTAKMIHNIALENPVNTTGFMAKEITRKLHQWGHKGKLYIGGDATSQKEDVKQEKGHDLFRIMIDLLSEFKPIRRVSTSNPSVIISFEFLNSILEENTQGLSFMVDSSCRKAILDFENTKEDKNGKVDKTTKRNPVTNVLYQPWGHFCDLTRYFFTTIFASEYAKFQANSMIPTIKSGNNLESKPERF